MSIQKVEIKDIVRKLRTESGMSRKKLGHECNRSEEAIKNFESGNNPGWDTVMAIALVFDMNLGDLNPCIGKEVPAKEDEKKQN